MSSLTVTSRGQVTFRKDVLKHLGIQPGDKIRLELLPNGRAELRAEEPRGSWRDVYGVARRAYPGAPLTIDEIEEAIAESGAKAGMAGIGEP